MRVFGPGYAFSSNEKWTLGMVVAIVLFVLARAFFPALPLPLRCPSHEFLGLDCPGCGITRATVSLLKLQFGTAVRYNPLILFVAPYVIYRLASLLVGIAFGRILVTAWPRWFLQVYQWGFLVCMGVLGAWRLKVWVLHLLHP
jgi:hypothetical protein